mgnify:CR=1 FL=1
MEPSSTLSLPLHSIWMKIQRSSILLLIVQNPGKYLVAALTSVAIDASTLQKDTLICTKMNFYFTIRLSNRNRIHIFISHHNPFDNGLSADSWWFHLSPPQATAFKKGWDFTTSTLSSCNILFCDTVFTIESFNTSTSCSCFLLSCVEWMTFRTDFYVDAFFCRSCYECVTTVACNCCLMIFWMDSFSHDFHLSYCIVNFRNAIPGQCRSDVTTTRYPGLTLQVPTVFH